MASEAGIVLGILAYFAALTTLLGLSGFTGETVNFLAEPEAATMEERASNYVSCVADVKSLIPVIGTVHFVNCAVRNVGLESVPVIGPAITFTTNFVSFFFQLVRFETALHPIVVFVMIGPPGVVLAYIGLRLLRGGG